MNGKNGQNTDIKERIEKVRQKQPEVINFLEKESTRKGLETTLEAEVILKDERHSLESELLSGKSEQELSQDISKTMSIK